MGAIGGKKFQNRKPRFREHRPRLDRNGILKNCESRRRDADKLDSIYLCFESVVPLSTINYKARENVGRSRGCGNKGLIAWAP